MFFSWKYYFKSTNTSKLQTDNKLETDQNLQGVHICDQDEHLMFVWRDTETELKPELIV